MRKGRSILQQWDCNNAVFCLEEGTVLSHFAEWGDADTRLRQGLELEMSARPDSQLAVQLSNALAFTYILAGQWKAAQDLCEWILSNWEHSEHPFELLTALFCYYCSSNWLALCGISRDSSERLSRMVVDSQRCQCLVSLIHIIVASFRNTSKSDESISNLSRLNGVSTAGASQHIFHC